MRKLIILVMAAFMVEAIFAYTSIRWRVEKAALKGEESGSLSFAYAMIAMQEGKSKTYLQTFDSGTSAFYDTCYDADPTDNTSTYDVANEASIYSVIPVGDGVGKTFVVQLYDDSDELIGYSDSRAYAELYAANNVYVGDSINGTGATTWVVSSFNDVPEPTSALLMLLGFAGLSLKRKHV